MYRYKTLEAVLKSIADDDSHENLKRQTARLTTDERRHLRALMNSIEHNLIDLEYMELFGEEKEK
jgi:uncharacterized protein HemY